MKKYVEYKDSGIEWIGKIPSEWKTKKVKLQFDVINGATPRSGEETFWDGDIMWVTPADYKTEDMYLNNSRRCITKSGFNSCGTSLVPKNSIIISNRAPIGSVALATQDLCTSQGCKSLVKKTEINDKYYYYFFSIMSNPLNMLGRGTTFLELSSSDLENFYIPIPPLQIQQTIADYLDRKTSGIDTLIADKQKLIDLLREKRQATISEAVTKGLGKTAKMIDSGIDWIGEIPERWEMSKSRWLFAERKERARADDIQLTASQQFGIVNQKEFMAQEGQRVVQVIKGEDILKHVEVNDFVISMRSFQGGIEWSGLQGKISSAYVMLIPNEKVYPQFYKWLLKTPSYIQALQSTSNLIRDGQALRYTNFKMVDLPVVPIEEQVDIANYLNDKTAQTDYLISDISLQIEKLKEYRQSIIGEAVTGKVAV